MMVELLSKKMLVNDGGGGALIDKLTEPILLLNK